jgi:septum site-determining protein MinD
MKKVIGVFSSKGGVGKTTCALNLAMAMHQMGSEAMLVDCDIRNSNLGLHLGIYDFPITLQDVLEGDMNFLEAVHVHNSGLRIVPASVSLRELRSDLGKLAPIFDKIEHDIVLDTPPGVNDEVAKLIRMCTDVAVITSPDLPSVTDSMKTIQLSKDMGRNVRGIIINRAEGRYELNPGDIEKVCGVPIIGIVPEDRNVKKGLFNKMPVVAYKPHAPSSIALKKIGAKIIEREYSPSIMTRIKSILFS